MANVSQARRKAWIVRLGPFLSRMAPILILAVLSSGPGCGVGSTGSRPKAEFAPLLGVCTSIGNAAILKSSGCDYVEEGVRHFLVPDKPENEFRQKQDAFMESPLPILACNGFLPETLKSVGPEPRHDEILAFAETAFRRARETGISTIVFGSSGSRGIPEGFAREEARSQFVRLLRRMGPLAAAQGIVVVIEPLCRAECNFINTVAEGAGIVRETAHPNIRLLADFYHMLRENEGPESLIAAGSLLEHCHIAEKAGRTPPGSAGDDFAVYFQALRKINYTGGISIECRWDDLAVELPVAVETLRRQIAAVNKKRDGP